jgi:hypothetical protein
VTELMVGHHERAAGTGIEYLSAELLAHGDEAVFAKRTIQ